MSNTDKNHKYRQLLTVLSLALLSILFFWRLALTELVVGRGDIFFYFYPYRDYASAAARAGHIPLWNPWLFMGAPFAANSQAGFFYPLNLILAGLPVERLINTTLVLHAALAAIGAYLWGRRDLALSRSGAWLSGLCFGLGGYFSAQVEHVNQVQVLAWLPWMLWLYGRALSAQQRADSAANTLLLSATVGLAFFAGHIQSVFICLLGLAGYALLPVCWRWIRRRAAWQALVKPIIIIASATAISMSLAAVQLLLTWELTQFSIRSGGLPYNEAVSFSLNPLYLGRALLPGWDEVLFPEFVAHIGVAALALALIGGVRASQAEQSDTPRLGALLLTVLGLFLALGGYNPIYWVLVRVVPGFGLFRAPARWLALYGLGAAGLAGLGFDWFTQTARPKTSDKHWLTLSFGGLLLALLVLAGELLIAGGYLSSNTTVKLNPSLSATSVIGWFVATALFVIWLINRRRATIVGLVIIELLAASTRLPFNQATAPGALTSLRPAVAHLLAEAKLSEQNSSPPARFLSISDIFFDPGDKAEIEIALGPQLSDQAIYDYLVATKQKEVLIPNLPLYYRLPAADGYDGGVLPLRRYVTLERLFMPQENVAIDGRLRENLDHIPAGRWLSLFNVRFVITDKVQDAWLDGIFYDLQHSAELKPGDQIRVGHLPSFAASALGIVYQAPGIPPGTALAELELIDQSGEVKRLVLRAGQDIPKNPNPDRADLSRAQLSWGQSRRLQAIKIHSLEHIRIRGASLIDERSQTFQSLVISSSGHYRLVHSGDVKIYENLDVLPRAFFVGQARLAADDTDALALMRDPSFDPARVVVLASQDFERPPPATDASKGSSMVRITQYQPEHVEIAVESSQSGWLVFSDAWYPGWQAQVDGQNARIERADILFRAVAVPVGRHKVVFDYRPRSFRLGGWISLVAWGLVLGGVLVAWGWKKRKS